MVKIIYRDFLSGRVKVPLVIQTKEDELGFDTEIICLSKDIRLILDDGSEIPFSSGANLDDVAAKAELVNELVDITDPSQIAVFDSSETIKTDHKSLKGAGFYDGFQEWWLIHRVINRKSLQFLRFNLKVDLDDGEKLLLEAGTRWTKCIEQLENYHMRNSPPVERKGYETVFCTRRCYSPTVPLINPDDLPADLMKDIDSIMKSDD